VGGGGSGWPKKWWIEAGAEQVRHTHSRVGGFT